MKKYKLILINLFLIIVVLFTNRNDLLAVDCINGKCCYGQNTYTTYLSCSATTLGYYPYTSKCSDNPSTKHDDCNWTWQNTICGVTTGRLDGSCYNVNCGGSSTASKCNLNGCKASNEGVMWDTGPCSSCTITNGGWTAWTTCTDSACGGTQTRTCTNPSPSCWGAACTGATSQSCGGGERGTPGAPTIVSPIGSVTDPVAAVPPVTLRWSAVSLADSYSVLIRNLNTGTTTWVNGISGTSVTVSLSFGYTFSWQVRAVNTTCGTETGAFSALGYFMTDYVPTLDSLTLKNSSGTIVAPDALLRNNICQKGFMYDPLPRRVTVEAKIRDTDVAPDGVKNATLRWNGRLYPLVLGPRVANVWTGTTTLDYPISEGSVGPFNWELQASDLYVTSAWINSGKAWKIWSCQVPVSGTVFDGSAGQACNTSGFTVAADNKLGFSSLVYKDMSASDDISMSTSLPATYGTTNVIYGKDYLPLFNGGTVASPDGTIIGTGRFTRGIDLGTGTTVCATFLGSQSQFNLENIISAYSANPRAQIDFSFIRDQESWFQVAGGGVRAKTDIDSGVPVTALPLASRALSILGTRAGNSLIAYGGNFRNINGYNDTSAYGKPNNWYVNRNANDLSNYTYQYFYNTFFINGGVGVTGTNWTSHPSEGVYFVNGDLTIDSDFALAANKTLIVVVKGKITIDSGVNRLDGIYIADGNSSDVTGIEAGGNSDNQLVINGTLYSRKGIRLYRTFTTKRLNNTTPAVKVNYEANLLFNMPGTLMKVLSGWREE